MHEVLQIKKAIATTVLAKLRFADATHDGVLHNYTVEERDTSGLHTATYHAASTEDGKLQFRKVGVALCFAVVFWKKSLGYVPPCSLVSISLVHICHSSSLVSWRTVRVAPPPPLVLDTKDWPNEGLYVKAVTPSLNKVLCVAACALPTHRSDNRKQSVPL